MFLTKLALLNFKNHQQCHFSFKKKLNCFIGNNGAGKTNLLDAIYYLCLTKSYFNVTDQQNILFGQDFFRLEGTFEESGENSHIVYKLQGGRKKDLSINDVPVSRLSDHVGRFPAIIITPDDSQLILGSSEERRKFLDSAIAQVNHEYLVWLMTYNKVLAQRNAALKKMAEERRTDKALLDTYNRQLVPLGNAIFEARQVAIEKLVPVFNRFYQTLSLEREQVSMDYVSQLNNKPFNELLDAGTERDLILQRTDAGIHKDDIDFFILPPTASANTKIKKFGSQGQQKSFIISLKFAQYHFIHHAKGFQPLLLIDDIFDKLDTDRSRKLIEMIAGSEFGQVFMTDTDEAHIREALKGKEDLYEVMSVK